MNIKGIANSSTNWTRTAAVSSQTSLLLVQVFLGGISVLALLGNGLVCLAVARDRGILRSVYNKLLFSLALTDMLTGISILATPTLVIDGNSFPVLNGVAGELFCRLVYSQYFVYALGKVSVFTVVTMSLERWYAVLKPLQYKLKFKRKRMNMYILVIWILGFVCVGFIPFGRVFTDSVTNQCVWSWAPFHREILITLYPLLTFFTPSAIACVTILHIYVLIKRSKFRETENRNLRTKRKLLRLCSIVVIMLTLCWLPNKLYYVLSAYDITTLETPFHYFTTVLAMSNSSLNPWVYCFANGQIKRGVLSLFEPVIDLFRKHTIVMQGRVGVTGKETLQRVPLEMPNVNDGILLSFRNQAIMD